MKASVRGMSYLIQVEVCLQNTKAKNGQRTQNSGLQQQVLIEYRRRRTTIWSLVLTLREMNQLKQMRN